MKNRLNTNGFLRLISFAVGLLTSNVTASEIDYSRLFLKVPAAEQLQGYLLVAHYFSDHRSLFVATGLDSNSYEILEIGQEVEIGPRSFKITGFFKDQLLLKDINEVLYFIPFEKEDFQQAIKVDANTIESGSSWSGKMFATDDTALETFKKIAQAVGVPKFISSQFTSLPKPGRTLGGRPGWLLDDTIPKLLLLASPFKADDLIINIDGVNTHHLDELQQHLREKKSNKYFDIEIQRNGNLKMLRIRL